MKKLKTGVREAEWYYMRRANWWEPFAQSRGGFGGAVPHKKDYSEKYKVKGQKVNSVKFYGLEKGETFVPLRAVLEFNSVYLCIDRAVHYIGPEPLILFEPKTHKEIEKISRWPHTLIKRYESRDETDLFKESCLDELPFMNDVVPAEQTPEEYSGLTLSELLVRGNFTLAVGALLNSVIVIYEENRFWRMGTMELSEKAVAKSLGDNYKKLAPFYVLVVEGGTYKSNEGDKGAESCL